MQTLQGQPESRSTQAGSAGMRQNDIVTGLKARSIRRNVVDHLAALLSRHCSAMGIAQPSAFGRRSFSSPTGMISPRASMSCAQRQLSDAVLLPYEPLNDGSPRKKMRSHNQRRVSKNFRSPATTSAWLFVKQTCIVCGKDNEKDEEKQFREWNTKEQGKVPLCGLSAFQKGCKAPRS